MPAKLSDADFVERTRANNRRRAERQRERLVDAGRCPLTVWIPDAVHKALTTKAANDGATIAAVATELLSAALGERNGVTISPDPQPNTADLFAAGASTPDAETPHSVCTDRAELMTAIGAMIDAGLSGAEIARRLNADGQRTAKGAEFSGANVLRDWRRWKESHTGV